MLNFRTKDNVTLDYIQGYSKDIFFIVATSLK